jgi:transposase
MIGVRGHQSLKTQALVIVAPMLGVTNFGQLNAQQMARKGKEKERQLARELYTQTSKNQKDIAALVGVSENTLTKWAKEDHWEQLRAARMSTPAELVNNMVEIHHLRTQQILVEIRSGSQHKFGDELLKMAQAIEKTQGKTHVAHYLQVLSELMAFIPSSDTSFRQKMAEYQSRFLTEKAAGQ